MSPGAADIAGLQNRLDAAQKAREARVAASVPRPGQAVYSPRRWHLWRLDWRRRPEWCTSYCRPSTIHRGERKHDRTIGHTIGRTVPLDQGAWTGSGTIKNLVEKIPVVRQPV